MIRVKRIILIFTRRFKLIGWNGSMKDSNSAKPTGINFFRSIRGQMVFGFLVLGLIPLLIIGIASSIVGQDALRHSIFDRLSSVVGTKKLQIEQSITQAEANVQAIANSPSIAGSPTDNTLGLEALDRYQYDSTKTKLYQQAYQQALNVLQTVSESNRDISGIFLIDQSGLIIAASTTTPSLAKGKAVRTADYFINGLAAPYVSDITQVPDLDRLVIFVASPVINSQHQSVGVVVALFQEQVLASILNDYSGLGTTGQIYLINQNQMMLSQARFSTQNTVLTQYVDSLSAASVLKADGESEYLDYRHVPVIGAWQQVFNWGIVAEIEQSEAYQPIYALLTLSAAIMVGASIVIILVAYFLSDSISRPIMQMTRTAVRIASGAFDERISFSRNSEVDALAQAFNTMSEQLAVEYQTLEKRVEERTVQLHAAQIKAELASQAKSTFLSNMSHELRTPLNIIIGYTSSMLDMPELYENRRLAPVHRRDIQLVKDSGYYLLGLINDILDLSKIESGKLELHHGVVDLIKEFKGIIATSIGLVKDKPIQIRPDFPDDLPLAWADPTRVRQIILNLMSNAIKFTQTGSVSLHAHVEDQKIVISVIDTGIGIAEKALPHIFDRFAQAERDTDKNFGGTGLGLDISKQLAQMHDGDLTVQSTLGQGSIFTFTLQIAEPNQIAESTPKDRTTTSVKRLAPAQVLLMHTILIAEDDSSLRDVMRRTLENDGYIVVDVQDENELMNVATGLLPDLIVLGLHMSEAKQHALLETIRQHGEISHIPVIVCGDTSQPNSVPGVKQFSCQPFLEAEFRICIQEFLPKSIEASKGSGA
jgi:signal transduction histidine kinase/CheY-like chemotaxis protein